MAIQSGDFVASLYIAAFSCTSIEFLQNTTKSCLCKEKTRKLKRTFQKGCFIEKSLQFGKKFYSLMNVQISTTRGLKAIFNITIKTNEQQNCLYDATSI